MKQWAAAIKPPSPSILSGIMVLQANSRLAFWLLSKEKVELNTGELCNFVFDSALVKSSPAASRKVHRPAEQFDCVAKRAKSMPRTPTQRTHERRQSCGWLVHTFAGLLPWRSRLGVAGLHP